MSRQHADAQKASCHQEFAEELRAEARSLRVGADAIREVERLQSLVNRLSTPSGAQDNRTTVERALDERAKRGTGLEG